MIFFEEMAQWFVIRENDEVVPKKVHVGMKSLDTKHDGESLLL